MINKKEYFREYYKKNRERYKEYIKKYQQSDKGKKTIKERNERYKKDDGMITKRREYNRKKMSLFENRVKYKLYNRLRRYLNNAYKTGEVVKLSEDRKMWDSLQYNIDFEKLIKSLLPLPNNFEDYEVDHIVPLCKFDFNKPEEIGRAYSINNIRIITKEENKIKGSRILTK